MYDEVVTLIDIRKTTNQYGDIIETRSEREVFADVRSIGQSEFYQASAVGLRPEVKFVLPDYLDYANEKVVKYTPFCGDEDEYTVIRTYRNSNEMELICRRGVDE